MANPLYVCRRALQHLAEDRELSDEHVIACGRILDSGVPVDDASPEMFAQFISLMRRTNHRYRRMQNEAE